MVVRSELSDLNVTCQNLGVGDWNGWNGTWLNPTICGACWLLGTRQGSRLVGRGRSLPSSQPFLQSLRRMVGQGPTLAAQHQLVCAFRRPVTDCRDQKNKKECLDRMCDLRASFRAESEAREEKFFGELIRTPPRLQRTALSLSHQAGSSHCQQQDCRSMENRGAVADWGRKLANCR